MRLIVIRETATGSLITQKVGGSNPVPVTK
jgi:hypothetical protein